MFAHGKHKYISIEKNTQEIQNTWRTDTYEADIFLFRHLSLNKSQLINTTYVLPAQADGTLQNINYADEQYHCLGEKFFNKDSQHM